MFSESPDCEAGADGATGAPVAGWDRPQLGQKRASSASAVPHWVQWGRVPPGCGVRAY